MIACLWAPSLPLQALLRAEPELRGQAVAILEQGQVTAMTFAAARQEVRPGMTATAALAVCPHLTLRTPAREIVRAAAAALADVAYGFSPHVEAAEPGWIYFDASGLGRLHETAQDLQKAVLAAAQRVGLSVRVGIGSGKFAAKLRARWREVVVGVLPVEALEPSPEAASRLARWGVRKVADLAALAPPAVGRRLGEEGARLARRARAAIGGQTRGDDPLCPAPAPLRFEEAIELDWALYDVESLAFVVRGLLERLVARLHCRALAASALEVRLALDPRGMHEIQVPLRAPTRQVATMTTLVRLAVAAQPPDRGVTGIAIVARPAPPATDQLSLFDPVPPPPETLQATVARVEAIVGPGHVGSPQVLDSHRPDAQRLIPFAPPRTAAATAPAGPHKVVALRWLPPTEELDALAKVQGARVTAHAGPWRLSADWWREPFERDYYEVRTVSGAIYLVCRNLERWQVVGMFD
ncbi:MAG TPA: DNA polymerase Y family protein [Polyangia bacterium]|nr:DNA polymerase Y family protein [Polyangia bacterium]